MKVIRTVIWVDADQSRWERMAALLAQAGLKVKTAAGLDECIAAMATDLPDAVVSPLHVAGYDALEIVRVLRGTHRHVRLLSGSPDQPNLVVCASINSEALEDFCAHVNWLMGLSGAPGERSRNGD